MTSTDEHTDNDIAVISDKLLAARTSCTGLPGFPGALPQTLETAYKIQERSMSKWDDNVIGWKIGGIPPHLQEQLQDVRLCGPIYEKSVKRSDGTDHLLMPVFKEGYSAFEAEFIIELGDTSALPATGLTQEHVESVITRIFIGFEMASSPIQNVNAIGSTAVISDFGINSGIIIGPEVTNWRDIDLSSVNVTVNIDGTLFGPTPPKPALEGPFGAVKFLIEHLKKRGTDIPVGTLASTGAITGVHDSGAGAKAEITFDGLGKLSLELVPNA